MFKVSLAMAVPPKHLLVSPSSMERTVLRYGSNQHRWASFFLNRCIVEDNYDFKKGVMSSNLIFDEMLSFTMDKYY